MSLSLSNKQQKSQIMQNNNLHTLTYNELKSLLQHASTADRYVVEQEIHRREGYNRRQKPNSPVMQEYMASVGTQEFNKYNITDYNTFLEKKIEELKREHVKQLDEVMNLGMDARQGQLQGYENRSGNEILQEFINKNK